MSKVMKNTSNKNTNKNANTSKLNKKKINNVNYDADENDKDTSSNLNNSSSPKKYSKNVINNKQDLTKWLAEGTPKVLRHKNNTDDDEDNNKEKDNFADTTPTTTQLNTSYGDIIDLLSVSATANGKAITMYDKFKDFTIMFMKYSFLVLILSLNFIGLSASLNCNADEELFKRIASAIFAFFFGFVYLLINYYTYKVMYQGKICKFNKEKLFPFKA
jgi:hypothetical protein